MGVPLGQAGAIAFGAQVSKAYGWRTAFLAIGVAGFHPPGHPKMHAEPGAAGETEGHLFGRRERLHELRASERLGQRLRVYAAADTSLWIKENLCDLPPDARIPASAEIFDFSEFGHEWNVSQRATSASQRP